MTLGYLAIKNYVPFHPYLPLGMILVADVRWGPALSLHSPLGTLKILKHVFF